MDKISIVVPCYNNGKEILIFYEEIIKIVDKMKKQCEFELIFVNDGSSDNTLEVLCTLSNKDKRLHYISFSRTFGRDASVVAGLEASRGDFIGVIDVHLQNPPALIEDMYEILKKEDYDCVGTCYVYHKIFKTKVVNRAGDFRLMTRRMLNSILELKEYNCFSKEIFSWVGYNIKWLEYKNAEKVNDIVKKNLWKESLYLVEKVLFFSKVPLIISSILGILFCFISFFALLVALIKGKFVMLYMCFILFGCGVQLFFMGIVGKYLSNIYLEVKRRPAYIVKETDVSKM